MEISQHVRAVLSFIETADIGSFAGAARQLNISAAAVSKNISVLEKTLGVRLMNRTTRNLSLTEEGKVFLKHARIALEALDTAVETVIHQKMEVSGHVRISMSSAFGCDQVLPLLPELNRKYPLLSIEIDFDDRVIDLVNNHYDIVIRGGRIIDSSLISRPVCKLNTVLVASPQYLEKHGIPLKPEDLKAHQLIARRFLGGKVSPWNFQHETGGIMVVEPESATLTLSSPEAQLHAALMGVGIAQVAVYLAVKYFKSGELKAVLTDQYTQENYEMVIQYPHRSLVAPRVRTTIDYLLECFEKNEVLHFPIEEIIQYQAN